MGIPLQPVNLAPFARNPMLNITQIASGLSGLQTQASQRKLAAAKEAALRQQTQQSQQMMPAQLQTAQSQQQLMQAKVGEAQEQARLREQYPELALGQGGQSLALLDYMSKRNAAQPAVQAASPADTSPPSGVSQQEDDLGYPATPAQAYAHKKVQDYYKSIAPPTASSLGYHFDDPKTEQMANMVLQKEYPFNWGRYQAVSMPSRIWQSLPSNFKESDLALGAGLGLSSTAANQYFASGHTPQQLAQAAHIPYHLMRRVYPPTGETVSSIQRQQYRTNALEAVNDIAASWLSPYIKTVGGVSPKLIYQSLTKQTKDRGQIARGLAAAAVQPEIAIMRQVAQGGRVSVRMAHDMQTKALSNLHQYQALVDPATYRLMQQNYQTLINLSTDAAGRYLSGQISTLPPETREQRLASSPGALGAQTAMPTEAATPSTPLTIPSFKDRSAWNKWYGNLSHAQQLETRKKLGEGQ